MPRSTRLTLEERATKTILARELELDGKTHEQIAAIIGMSRQWVSKELAREEDTHRYKKNAVPAGEKRATLVGVARSASSTPGRMTLMPYGGSGRAMQTILPPPDYRSRWVNKGLDMAEWDRIGTPELLRILRHMSPDVSRAIWDYLRLLNPGYEIVVYKPNSDDPDERAQEKLNEFIGVLEDYYGSFKVICGRLFMNAMMRGAMLIELVTDKAARKPIDLVAPDPVTIRFKKVDDPRRGPIWQMGQWQNGEFVSLDYPTIAYIGVDAESDNPYGTPMLGSAIFPCLFLIGLLHDLRRVVAQQGYPRTHIVLDVEKIHTMFPGDTDDELDQRIDDLQDDIAQYYATLQPDDAFITTNSIDVQTNGGAIATQVLASSAALIEVLERMSMRALKTMPLLMGSTDNTGESNANRQYEIFAEGVNSLQQDAENLLGGKLQLAMEIQGVQCRVELRFAKVRAAEEARDEQTFKLRLENAIMARDTGFWDQEQASMHAVHAKPALEEAPAPVPVAATEDEGEQTEDEAQEEDGDQGDRLKLLWNAFSPDERKQVQERLAALGITRAVDISDADSVAVDDAVGVWQNVFAGEDVETLLDAAVAAGDGDDGQ